MPIDPLQTWKQTLNDLPKVADSSWAKTFAAWYGERILSITTDPAVFAPVGFVFTFAQPIFAAQLLALTPKDNALAGIQGFADAWAAALTASTALVAPGSAKLPPAPPPGSTVFSIVASTIIDPASIAAGKAKIAELVSAPSVKNGMDSEFPVKFREATLLLTVTISGTDTQLPPTAGAGPQPLVVPTVPLV